MRLAGLRPQRWLRGGVADPRLRQRAGALARRAGRAGPARRRRTWPRIGDTVRPLRHRLPLGAHRRARRGHRSRTRSTSSPRRRPRCGPAGTTSACSTGTQVRAEVDSPTYLAGLLDPARHRHGRAGPAGLGAAAGLPGPRGADPRADPGRPGSSTTAGACEVRTARGVVRADRVALAHERVPAAAAPAAADDRAGLRPRAGHRAAVRGAAGRRSAGAAGRASATPRTCSTTTG